MALKARLDSLDTLDDSQKGFYKPAGEEEGSGYVLDVEPVGDYALEDVGGLRRALETQSSKRAEAREALERWEKLDRPLDQLQRDLGELEELRKIDPDKEAEKLADTKVKARIEEIQSRATEEITGLKGRIEKMTGFMERRLRTDVAERLIKEAGGEPELLMPIVERETRIRWADEDVPVVEVLNKDGAPRIKDAQTGAQMGLPDLIEEMKSRSTLAGAFKGLGAEGSGAGKPGARGNDAVRAAGAPKHRGDFSNAAEKAAWVRENGLEAWQKLPLAPREGGGPSARI